MSIKAERDSVLPPLWIITLLVVALLGWLAYELKELMMLVIIGYIVAYVIDPVLDAFEKRKLSRSLGVFSILIALTLLVVVLALTAVPTIVREFNALSENLPSYIDMVGERLEPLKEQVNTAIPGGFKLDFDVKSLLKLGEKIDKQYLKAFVNGIFGALLQGYSITLTIVNLFLLPFIIYYIAVDIDRIHANILKLFPVLQRQKVKKMASEIDVYVSAYVRGQLTVGAILFVLFAAGLGVLGVELWFLLAFVSGFGNLIPYVGSLIGIVLSSLMAFVTFGDFIHVVGVWILFGLIQFLEGTFITPNIVGNKVGLSPLVVILALVAGGSLFGLIGILLAIPGVATFRVLARYFHLWFSEKALGSA